MHSGAGSMPTHRVETDPPLAGTGAVPIGPLVTGGTADWPRCRVRAPSLRPLERSHVQGPAACFSNALNHLAAALAIWHGHCGQSSSSS